jgi:hypothetical protein
VCLLLLLLRGLIAYSVAPEFAQAAVKIRPAVHRNDNSGQKLREKKCEFVDICL